jgi:hypothetical protein
MNEILQLVQSMTTGEKRHFSLLNTHYERPGESNLLQLFHHYSNTGHDLATASKRKQTLSKAANKNKAADKHRLGVRVLESLTIYHSNSVAVFKLRRQLSEVELLVQRALYAEAAKRLRKVIEVCRDACLFELELEAWRLQVSINLQRGIWDMEAISKRRVFLLGCVREYDAYIVLLTRLFRFRVHFIRPDFKLSRHKEIAELLREPLLQPDYVPLSLFGQIGYHSFFEQYALIAGDTRKRTQHSQALVQIFTGNKLFAEVFFSLLLPAAINSLQNIYEARDLAGLKNQLKRIEAIIPPSNRLSGEQTIMLESVLHTGRLYVSLLEADFRQITSQEKVLMRIIGELEKLRHFRAFSLSYILALAFIAEGNYRKAARTIAVADPVKTLFRSGIRAKTQQYMLLLCHFRLGHFDMVQKIAAGIQRSEEAEEKRTQAETLLLDFFAETAKYKNQRLRERTGILLTNWSKLKKKEDVDVVKNFVVVRTELMALYRGTTFEREWQLLNTGTGAGINA